MSSQEAGGKCGWEKEGMDGNRVMEGVEHTGAMSHIWEPQDQQGAANNRQQDPQASAIIIGSNTDSLAETVTATAPIYSENAGIFMKSTVSTHLVQERYSLQKWRNVLE